MCDRGRSRLRRLLMGTARLVLAPTLPVKARFAGHLDGVRGGRLCTRGQQSAARAPNTAAALVASGHDLAVVSPTGEQARHFLCQANIGAQRIPPTAGKIVSPAVHDERRRSDRGRIRRLASPGTTARRCSATATLKMKNGLAASRRRLAVATTQTLRRVVWSAISETDGSRGIGACTTSWDRNA